VMISALAVHITNLKPVNETGFKFFADILWQVQLPLLLSVIFMKKSSGILSCCKTKSCCDTQKSCCGGGECDK
jgi:hypothetical protein